MAIPEKHKQIFAWYQKNKRPLPWRLNKDPYRIWVSETMLQQTTATAVVPYFENFLRKFPTLNHLATAPESEVMKAWAGLGYYSRARNLHRAAQQLAQKSHFPTSYADLLEYPGFGPYTARAVSSLAFGEKVGVLDGNVIRVLSRLENLKIQWWTHTGRQQLQAQVDVFAQHLPSAEMNQALMELGATVCLPKSPKCLICPWVQSCKAHHEQTLDQVPLAKPKKAREIWLWQPRVFICGDKIGLQKNDYAPFLKNQWLLPGEAGSLKAKPSAFDFKHVITHHDIFVKIQQVHHLKSVRHHADMNWVAADELAAWTPASLVHKTIALATTRIQVGRESLLI